MKGQKQCLPEKETRVQEIAGLQKVMENLMKVIGSRTTEATEVSVGIDTNTLDGEVSPYHDEVFEADSDAEKFSSSPSTNLSALDENITSPDLQNLTTFGSDEQFISGELIDDDMLEHVKIVTSYLQQLKAAAGLHLIQVKRRLLVDRDNALRTKELQHLDAIHLKDKEIAELQAQLASTEESRDLWTTRFDSLKSKVVGKISRNNLYVRADFSILKVFYNWKKFVSDQKNDCQLDKFAGLLSKRSAQAQTFARVNRDNHRSRIAKLNEEHKAAIDRLTKEVRFRALLQIVSLGISFNTPADFRVSFWVTSSMQLY